MLEGSCHCVGVRWRFGRMPESATACNCPVCRRHGVLCVYDYAGGGIDVSGSTHAYIRGKSIDFLFCPTCGCMASWRAQKNDAQGRRRIAVNLRLTEPALVAHLPFDHIDRLGSFEDLPRDGKCVADYWSWATWPLPPAAVSRARAAGLSAELGVAKGRRRLDATN